MELSDRRPKTMENQKPSRTKVKRQRRFAGVTGSAAGVESEVCKECFGSGVGQYSPLLLAGVTCKTCYGTGRMDKRQPQPND